MGAMGVSELTMKATNHQVYRAHALYRWVTLLLVLLTFVLVWSMVQNFSREGLFFGLIMLVITLWFGRLISNQVTLDERGLTLFAPLRRPQRVDFGQLLSVSESGRLFVVLTLLYHPRQPTGLLDLETVHSLTLPALTAQDQLLATLTAQIPQ